MKVYFYLCPMKKLILPLLILITQFSFSQNLTYFGGLNENITLKLTAKELLLYSDCVSAFGMDGQHITWVDAKTLDTLKLNKIYYSGEVATIDSKTQKITIKPILGIKKSPKEQFVFYIQRNKNKTIIKLYSFY